MSCPRIRSTSHRTHQTLALIYPTTYPSYPITNTAMRLLLFLVRSLRKYEQISHCRHQLRRRGRLNNMFLIASSFPLPRLVLLVMFSKTPEPGSLFFLVLSEHEFRHLDTPVVDALRESQFVQFRPLWPVPFFLSPICWWTSDHRFEGSCIGESRSKMGGPCVSTGALVIGRRYCGCGEKGEDTSISTGYPL